MASVALDGSSCRLTYLNEGGANFVFRITDGDGDKLPPRLQRRLLRLRKKLVEDPKELLLGTAEWAKILPVEHLIEHELVDLPAEASTAINEHLATVQRPADRMNDFWAGGTHGLLVTDMTPRDGERLIELKPKWLSQSPTAPTDAKRCRTCALRAQRAAEKGVITATDAQRSCPLDLVSGAVPERKLAAERLTDDRQVQEYLVEQAQPLVHMLRRYQQEWDPHGALFIKDGDDTRSLSKAMTIRDCTLFVLVRSDGGIEARLGDLDMKGPDKLGRWQAIEQYLLDGGWYLGEDSICMLSRS